MQQRLKAATVHQCEAELRNDPTQFEHNHTNNQLQWLTEGSSKKKKFC